MPAETLYGALDEEAGGESQPPHKSYGRIIFAGLALLAFVLIAVAAGAAGNDSHSPGGNLVAYGTCYPGTEPALLCDTTYAICKTKASKIPNGMLQQKFINICMNGARKSSLPKCCVN